jgi:hypothetical protein
MGGNTLGFETTPGFRLSREFETSRNYDLCPPRSHPPKRTDKADPFHLLRVSRRIMNDCPLFGSQPSRVSIMRWRPQRPPVSCDRPGVHAR